MDIFQPINITSATRTLVKNDSGGVITVNRAAGTTLILPDSAASGMMYRIFLGTTITSNNFILKVNNSTDIMSGVALQAQDAGSTINGWETGATDDTITFNGTTSGGVKGDFIELMDVSLGIWWVRITGSATGTEVTPFSSTV